MEADKGFFIENILKDSKSEKPEKISEEDDLTDAAILPTETEEENSSESEANHWLNPGSCSSSQILGMLPTVYPVISNRLDTHEGNGKLGSLNMNKIIDAVSLK